MSPQATWQIKKGLFLLEYWADLAAVDLHFKCSSLMNDIMEIFI